MTLLTMVLFAVALYFLMIRPASKKLREQQALQASLQEGDRVVLTTGMFGTIRHLGDRQAIVELAPGVDVTVLRGAISRTVTSDEEDFEYEDEAPEAVPAGSTAHAAPGVTAESDAAFAPYAGVPASAEPVSPYAAEPVSPYAADAPAAGPDFSPYSSDATIAAEPVSPYATSAGEPVAPTTTKEP